MKSPNIENLQAEIKRSRNQSYLFLLLLIIGVISTSVMYYRLHLAYEKIDQQYEDLEKQKVEIENQRNELDKKNVVLEKLTGSSEDLTDKEVLIKGILELASKTKDLQPELLDLYKLSIPELEAEASRIEKEINARNAARIQLVQKLFSASESNRKASRDELLKNHLSDKSMLKEILEESNGKVTLKHQESYWQIIYILDQLDVEVLQANKKELLDFFEQGGKIGLNGASTTKDINKIKAKFS